MGNNFLIGNRNIFILLNLLRIMGEKCTFCRIARKEIPVQIIYESDNFLVFPDANPRITGHCLIIPKKHFANILELPLTLGSELLDVIKNVAEIKLKEGFEGFNLIQNNFNAAGQIVMHSHIHFFPRKKDDGFKIDS